MSDFTSNFWSVYVTVITVACVALIERAQRGRRVGW